MSQEEAVGACWYLLEKRDSVDILDVRWLAARSGGVPIVIMLLCYTVRHSGNAGDIFTKKEIDFKQAVENFIGENIKKVKRETELRKN